MNQFTHDKLVQMRLPGMALEYKRQMEDLGIEELTFDQRIQLLVDAEYDSRHNNTIKRLMANAKLSESSASIEDIHYYSDRHLNRKQINELSTGHYIRKQQNIILIGATGSGKSYIACALGNRACRDKYSVKYIRLPDLLVELQIARLQGTYKRLIHQYKKCDLLIVDEWMLVPTTETEQRDLLEIIESRYRIGSAIFCSQISPEGWHSKLGGGPLADAIMDRIVPKSHAILIEGNTSMRQRV